jgi:hypothetical protein
VEIIATHRISHAAPFEEENGLEISNLASIDNDSFIIYRRLFLPDQLIHGYGCGRGGKQRNQRGKNHGTSGRFEVHGVG